MQDEAADWILLFTSGRSGEVAVDEPPTVQDEAADWVLLFTHGDQAGAEKLRWDKQPETQDKAADWILLTARAMAKAIPVSWHRRKRAAWQTATKLGRCRATVGCKEKGHKHHDDKRDA